MDVLSILGITAVVYFVLTWLLTWGGSFVFDRSPANVRYEKRKNKAPLQTILLLKNPEEQLEYAIRHVTWVSSMEGIPLQVYVDEENDYAYDMLYMIKRNWPDLPLEKREKQTTVFPLDAWILDLR
jgi:hypothetical protein